MEPDYEAIEKDNIREAELEQRLSSIEERLSVLENLTLPMVPLKLGQIDTTSKTIDRLLGELKKSAAQMKLRAEKLEEK